MQNFLPGPMQLAPTKWLKDKDLLYPCDTVKRKDKLYCYLMVTSRILPAVDYDFRRTAKWCRRAEKAWIATCFQSFGRDASGNSVQNPGKIVQLCRLAGSMARGISRGEAERLIVRGFFTDVLNRIELEPVREAVTEALEARDRVGVRLLGQDQVPVLLVRVRLLRVLLDLDHPAPNGRGPVAERALEGEVGGRVRGGVLLEGVVVEVLRAVGEVRARHA